MSEQVMHKTHQKCRCEVCVTHDDTAVCGACQVTWPCDAAVGRTALEAIALQAEGWRVGVPGINAFGEAVQVIRSLRDIARDALGGQQP